MIALEARLRAAGCINAAEESALLMQVAPGARALEAMVRRRERGEPLEWIVGAVTFCGRTLHIAAGVYIPRRQTEDLARRAADALPPDGTAADLCTGCGAIAAHLQAERPGAVVVGVEIDALAAAVTRRNGVAVLIGDLDEALPSRRFDVVTAVAPYVPSEAMQHLAADVQRYEPRRALDGGDDGLAIVRRVVAGAARLLVPGGNLLIELGGDQYSRLAPVIAAAGFGEVAAWFDDEGDLRGVIARRS